MRRLSMHSVSIVKRERSTPVYNIGVMSRLTGVPIHTLRWIEHEGFISPFRTSGNQRLFSDIDVDLIHEIRELMEQNVNLPGIRIILQMRVEKSALPRPPGKVKRREGRAVPARP